MDLLESKNEIVTAQNSNTLKAAIFQTLAFKLSVEINNNKITNFTKRSLLKVLYNNCRIKKQTAHKGP